MNLSEAKLHPERLFVSPHAVYNHPDMNVQDKIVVLTAWKNQLELKSNATSEGMMGKNGESNDELQLISKLLVLLQSPD